MCHLVLREKVEQFSLKLAYLKLGLTGSLLRFKIAGYYSNFGLILNEELKVY